MAEWKVERGPKTCTVTGNAFEEGELYYSALTDEKDLLQRLDFSEGAWSEQDKTNFLAFWRTHMPAANEEPKRRLVDSEVIYSIFSKMNSDSSKEKLTFRYLLALILVRKRFLRFDTITKEADGEYLILWDRRLKDTIKVLNPEADQETMTSAQKELSSIFDMDFDDESPGARVEAPGEDCHQQTLDGTQSESEEESEEEEK